MLRSGSRYAACMQRCHLNASRMHDQRPERHMRTEWRDTGNPKAGSCGDKRSLPCGVITMADLRQQGAPSIAPASGHQRIHAAISRSPVCG
jgi:hypothetical protein